MNNDPMPAFPVGLHRLDDAQPATATFAVDLSNCQKIRDALQAIGKALDLPDYYAPNLDALYDCLTDADWQKDAPSIVRCYGMTALQARDPAPIAALLETLEACCQAREEGGTAALAFILDLKTADLPDWPRP